MLRSLAVSIFLLLLAFPAALCAQQTSGAFLEGSIQIGYDSRACNGALEGSLRYSSSGNGGGGSEDITTGLTAYFNFDESAGTTAADSSGNGYDGSIIGNPAWSTAGGKVGGALDFDGTDDAVKAPNAALPTGDFTVSAWVKPNNLTSRRLWYIVDTIGSTDHKWGSPGDIEVRINNTVSINEVAGFAADSTWQHYALTRSGGTITVYHNGGFIGSATNSAAINNNASCELGIGAIISCTGDTSGTQVFDGLIDEFRTYNRALTPAQINALPGMVTTPPDITSNLQGHWTLDETSGTTATDSAGSNDGTMTGGLDAGTDSVAGQLGTALDFDGLDQGIDLGDNYDFAGQPITMCGWAKPQNGTAGYVMGKFDVGTSNGSYLRVDAGGWSTGTDGANKVRAAASADTGVWQHICGVLDPTPAISRLYKNGVAIAAGTTVPAHIDNTRATYIGNRYDNLRDWEGGLDDIRVYNRALSAADVTALYNFTGAGGGVQYCNGTAWTDWGN